MATIDRDDVIASAKDWLPASNILTDAQMLSDLETIILVVGDDDVNTPEVTCKLMRIVAAKNKAKATSVTGNLKREMLGRHEKEYHTSISLYDGWDKFEEELSTICPLIGYKPNKPAGRIKINPGETYSPILN